MSCLGIILVHDLTNRKSQENLHKWLTEVSNRENNSKAKKNEEYDVEQFVGTSQVNLKMIEFKTTNSWKYSSEYLS